MAAFPGLGEEGSPPPPTSPPNPPDLAGVEQGEAAQEDGEAGHRGGHQHVSVPAEPGKVQGHLLTKVVSVGTLPHQATTPPGRDPVGQCQGLGATGGDKDCVTPVCPAQEHRHICLLRTRVCLWGELWGLRCASGDTGCLSVGTRVICLRQCHLISSIGCLWTMFLHWAHFFLRSSSPWARVTDGEGSLPPAPPGALSQPRPTPHLVQGESSLKDPILHQIL